MLRVLRVALVVLALVLAGPVPAALAHSSDTIGGYGTVTLVPIGNASIEIDGRRYRGELQVTALPDGLALVERTDIDGYLSGIQEVPFGWHSEALAAQVVAARTYLAATLESGRSSTGRKYGYDICATSSCQVYAGAGLVDGPSGDRWAEAVSRTSGQLLMWGGRAASTYYHSTSGGRTEAIQDVWAGAAPVPYLVGAESAGEPSPFTEWRVEVSADVLHEVLAAGGYHLDGELIGAAVIPTENGEGVWRARFLTTEGAATMDVGRLKAIFNSHGPELHPEVLPGRRPSGRRYPQALLSYRFDMSVSHPLSRLDGRPQRDLLPRTDLPPETSLVIHGRGWGHHIGMSQYGALALAEEGLGYRDILAHFYGGLRPITVADYLPEKVTVGLAWGRDAFEVFGRGPFVLRGDGNDVFVAAGGDWALEMTPDGHIGLQPPDRLIPYLLFRLEGGRRYL